MNDNAEDGGSKKPIVSVFSREEGIGNWPRVTEIPTETLYVVDLKIKSPSDEPQFKRVLVTSMVEAVCLVVAPESVEYNVTVLRGRSADSTGALVSAVTKIDALPPSLLVYTLDDGDQFAIVDDGEPRRMLMCMDMGTGDDS